MMELAFFKSKCGLLVILMVLLEIRLVMYCVNISYELLNSENAGHKKTHDIYSLQLSESRV